MSFAVGWFNIKSLIGMYSFAKEEVSLYFYLLPE